jgi:hypothetical protein
MPVNGGLSYFDVNGMLKKSTPLALLGSKVSGVTAINDSTLQIVSDGGTTTVLIRGLFTLSRQRWFDSLRNGLIFDTIAVTQVGIGINSVYPNSTGKVLLVKGLQGSTAIGITRATDSSLIFTSLLNFTSSISASGANVTLVGDNSAPSDGSTYGKIAGSKGWFGISQYPVATSTTNGIMDFHEKLRLDSSITIVNATSGGAYDSIGVASPTLDTIFLKGLDMVNGVGFNITKTGNLFLNQYTFNLDSTKWLPTHRLADSTAALRLLIGGGAIASVKVTGVVGAGGSPFTAGTTYTNSTMIGRPIIVVRNKLFEPEGDPGNGDTYFTKSSGTITFSSALANGELIQIIILSS